MLDDAGQLYAIASDPCMGIYLKVLDVGELCGAADAAWRAILPGIPLFAAYLDRPGFSQAIRHLLCQPQ